MTWRYLCLIGAYAFSYCHLNAQGPLDASDLGGPAVGPIPPISAGGEPQPTMKTLHQIEPGVDISAGAITTISSPGRYFLSADIDDLDIDASRVTLDLRGFTVTGKINIGNDFSNVCVRNGFLTGTISAYQTSGLYATNGVFEDLRVDSAATSQVFRCGPGWTIRRCRIEGSGLAAISALGNATVEDCEVTNFEASLSGDILSVGSSSVVRNCRVTLSTGRSAVRPSSYCLVTQCVIADNEADGVLANSGLHTQIVDCNISGQRRWGITGISINVSRCTVNGNRDGGIDAGGRSKVEDCLVNGNVGDGIAARGSTSVRSCTVAHNQGNGIAVSEDNAVIDSNVIISNSLYGISLNSNNSSVTRNQLRDNDDGTIDQSGGDIAPVVSPASATNPFSNLD